MNLVIERGFLGKDAEISTYGEGNKRARLSLAVKRRGKDAGTDWINCTVFGKRAEVCEQYMKKGTQVEIRGHIQTGSYQNKDGQTVYTTEVIVDDFEFVGGGSGQQAQSGKQAESQAAVQENGEAFVEIPDNADDAGLPFNF